MNTRQTPLPSPLAGEGAEARSAEAGEGDLQRPAQGLPSAGRSLCSRPPSPARGEGSEIAAPIQVLSRSIKRARSLRAELTDAERKLWFALRDRRFAQFKFRRQVPMGPFFADFLCFELRVVVEVDGRQHVDSARDRQRDQWFHSNNFEVIRFWNNDVLRNLDGVMTVLLERLQSRQARGRNP